MNEDLKERRKSRIEHETFVVSELRHLNRQYEKIENHIVVMMSKMEEKFEKMELKIESNMKDVEGLKARATLIGTITSVCVSAFVSFLGLFLGRKT